MQTHRLSASALHATAFLLGLAMTSAAFAAGSEASSESNWGLGLAAVSTQKPYAGIDRDNTAFPLIYFENKYVRIFGPGVELKLHSLDLNDSQRVNFRLVGKYNGSGYEENDADILDGMSERKGGIWTGAKVQWEMDSVDVSAEWLADVSGNSKGQRLNLAVEKTWRFGEHVMLTPRLGATWLDKKYVDYYYGVETDEIMLNRPAYAGKSGVNLELGVRGNYIFDAHHSAFLDIGVTSLTEEIKDSPLVDRSTENRLLMGYMYRF
jgi:outer membrane protein